MNDFIEYVVRSLVDRPEDVVVTSKEDGKCTVYEVLVNKKDLGQVVGKNGKTANALRILTRTIARNDSKHIIIKIREAN